VNKDSQQFFLWCTLSASLLSTQVLTPWSVSLMFQLCCSVVIVGLCPLKYWLHGPFH